MPQNVINYPRLASIIFSVPHYVTRQEMDAVKAVLVPRLQGAVSAPITMALDSDSQPAPEVTPTSGAIAVIPIHGLLVSRRGQFNNQCQEITSYELIRASLHKVLNDNAVSEVVLDINSGGGMASGCKELADYIFQSRSIKPITAIVNFSAFSAAYFIASACSRVIVSQTAGVGSIGVIMEHMDASEWEANVGVKFTTIYRGDKKNAGTPHESLSDESRAVYEKMVDIAYEMFTSSVSQYRSMDLQAVIDTQAGLYFGKDAVDSGLADEIAESPQTAINNIAAQYTVPVPVSTKKSSIQMRVAVMDAQMKM